MIPRALAQVPLGAQRGRGFTLVVAVAAVLGCSGSDRVTAPSVPGMAPARPTPEAAARLLESAYVNRDTAAYSTLFTGDYRFLFDPSDSAGNAYPDTSWSLAQELTSARHLFVGGSATEPPATSIDLTENGIVMGDTDDLLDPATHRRISTGVVLNIRAGGGSLQVQGNVMFDVVRADVAILPAGLRPRVRPTDWLIYRWLDRTLPGGPIERIASPLPSRNWTWGMIKSLYL